MARSFFYQHPSYLNFGFNLSYSTGLIAINYPARKFGITRHLKADEARKLCPNLKAVHVATWRVGNDTAVCDYHPQSASSISTDKVSLDHYRRESKKILSILRANCPKVEKASVDESFLDLSLMVYERLIDKYKEELSVVDGVPIAPYADQTERLPLPEVGIIDWNGSHLIDLDAGTYSEEEPLDWDDVAMGIGAQIMADIRKKVYDQLKYTWSVHIVKFEVIAQLIIFLSVLLV